MNKKIAAVCSLAAATASLATSVSARDMYYEDAHPHAAATVAYESEYIFRGVQASKRVFRPGLEVGVRDLYASFEGIFSTDSDFSHYNQLNLSAGFRNDLDDFLLMDFGGVLYYFPRLDNEMPGEDDVTGDLYTGIGLGLPLNPWLYFSYDVVLEDFNMEGSLEHEIPLNSQWSVDLAAIGGHAWVKSGKPWMMRSVNYFYAGAAADLRFALDESSSVSLGGRFSTNDLSTGERAASGGANTANLWWRAAFTAEF